MSRKKSSPDESVVSPIAFKPCSNGEFCPTPETPRDVRAHHRFLELVEEHSRRLAVSRRDFARSSCGSIAALMVLNEVYGCSSAPGVKTDGIQCYDLLPSMLEDQAQAAAHLTGDEFILDVQVHSASPLTPWRDSPLPTTAENFVREIFVDSDTTVACLSGAPNARPVGEPNAEARHLLQEVIDRIGGPRLIFHVNADPPRGASELDYMEATAAAYNVAAWKVYPHVGNWRLDDDAAGKPFIEKARQLGINVIAAHRGIAADAGGYDDPSSPIDLVLAAQQYPDVTFLTYHSGWQGNVDEDHPFDPNNTNPMGVDRLIKAALDAGIGNSGNVYAELGSTWRNLMTLPRAAAHVFGKLLTHLGEDRIIWGTDAVFTGSPQEQIVAFRTFQIPDDMQQTYQYPAITDEIRAKIFGLNAAAAYNVDPQAVRCVIENDSVEQEKAALLVDPDAIPLPKQKNYGPKNRREFLAFLQWEKFIGA